MHETAVAEGIIKEAKRHGNVKGIFLEIGELAVVPKNELLECLGRLVTWKITSKERRAKVQCKCGFIGSPKILERGHDFFFVECQKCGKVPKVLDGTNIKILEVVVR